MGLFWTMWFKRLVKTHMCMRRAGSNIAIRVCLLCLTDAARMDLLFRGVPKMLGVIGKVGQLTSRVENRSMIASWVWAGAAVKYCIDNTCCVDRSR